MVQQSGSASEWYNVAHETMVEALPMKRQFSASVSREGAWYIAQCLEVDVASQGQTEDEALQNLREALELYFAAPTPTLTPQIRSVEVDTSVATSITLPRNQTQA